MSWTAGVGLGVLATWVGAYAGAVFTAHHRARSAALPRGAPPPGDVAVIRPCAGTEPALESNLRSTGDPTCSVPIRIVLCTASAEDSATPVIERAALALRDAGHHATATVVDTHATNHKVGQLSAAVAALPPSVRIVVWVDSDVELSGLDLDRVLAGFAESSSLGAVWVPVTETYGDTVGDRASGAVLSASFHNFRTLSQLDRGSMVGKFVAIRREALTALGDLVPFSDVLGEDVAIARALRAGDFGIRPVLVPALARSRHRTLRDAVERFARWVQVLRTQRPARLAGYPSFFAPLVPLMCLAIAVGFEYPAAALGLFGIFATARMGLAAAGNRGAGLHRGLGQAVVDAILGDLVLTAAFFRGTTRRSVRWRGRELAVGSGGRLSVQGRREPSRHATTARRLVCPAHRGARAQPRRGAPERSRPAPCDASRSS